MDARTRKPAKIKAKQEWSKSLKKGIFELLDALEKRGLLEQEEIRRLFKNLDEIAEQASLSSALSGIGGLHRRLAACLGDAEGVTDSVRRKRIEALLEVNRLIAHTQEPAECFSRLLSQVGKLIPCEAATLLLVDRKTGRLNVAKSVGHPTDLIERIEFDKGLGFSGWVAKTQKPILFNSLKRSQPTHAGLIKSFMAVPLIVAGDTVGVMTLGHSNEGIFSKEDLRLLILLASQAGGIIQKTLLIEEIKDLAITDDLTGLYNRRHFLVRLQDEVARASRFLQDFSVVFLDVDEFKRYNDAYGHETGDRALSEIGNVLKSLARATDIVARYGGEEFVVLLPATGREEALIVAERVRVGIESHVFPRRKKLTVSVGVATYPEDSSEPQELLNFADKALYQAKREGRNRIVSLPAVAA